MRSLFKDGRRQLAFDAKLSLEGLTCPWLVSFFLIFLADAHDQQMKPPPCAGFWQLMKNSRLLLASWGHIRQFILMRLFCLVEQDIRLKGGVGRSRP